MCKIGLYKEMGNDTHNECMLKYRSIGELFVNKHESTDFGSKLITEACTHGMSMNETTACQCSKNGLSSDVQRRISLTRECSWGTESLQTCKMLFRTPFFSKCWFENRCFPITVSKNVVFSNYRMSKSCAPVRICDITPYRSIRIKHSIIGNNLSTFSVVGNNLSIMLMDQWEFWEKKRTGKRERKVYCFNPSSWWRQSGGLRNVFSVLPLIRQEWLRYEVALTDPRSRPH